MQNTIILDLMEAQVTLYTAAADGVSLGIGAVERAGSGAADGAGTVGGA